MCRVPAGPPPAALYEAPTWLDEGPDDTALPAPGGLLQAGAPLPPSNDADAALLDSLLLGTGGEVAAPKAEPVVKAEPPPLPVVASRAFAPAPAHAPAFLAGMFAGLPYTPTGLVSHATAAQLAASLPKRPSSFPDDDDDGDDDATGDTNVERVKKRRRESAQRSRARKSAFVRALEVENAALRAAVGHLEAALATLTGRPGGESAVTAAAAAAAAIARQAPPIVTPGGTAGSAYHQHATHTATHAPARADSSAASGASTPGAARAADAAAAAARAATFGGMVPV